MSTESKSGYQLRFDILCLARDILSDESERKAKNITEDDPNAGDGTGSKSTTRREAPSVTTEEVLTEAQKLYDFVLTKKD